MNDINFERLRKGEYEIEYFPPDFNKLYPPPDYQFNILHHHGLLDHPMMDGDLLNREGKKPVWPDGKHFAVCLTHDVDRVSAYCRRQALRRLFRSLMRSNDVQLFPYLRRILGALKICRNALLHQGKDPLHNFEDWLTIEDSFNARSTFFFFPEKVKRPHLTDCIYSFSDRIIFENQQCTVAELIKEIDMRGWEIGLHASWYAFNDSEALKFEKEQIEKTVGHEIVSIRQHILHYDIGTTPRSHANAGFLYDTTLGFNRNIGFRFGTSYPFHLYDLMSCETLPILEIPLIVQDVAIFDKNGLNVNSGDGFRLVYNLASVIKRVGGVLTVLWHPDAPHIDIDRWSLYEKLLNKFKEMGAWITDVKNIGEIWHAEQSQVNRP